MPLGNLEDARFLRVEVVGPDIAEVRDDCGQLVHAVEEEAKALSWARHIADQISELGHIVPVLVVRNNRAVEEYVAMPKSGK